MALKYVILQDEMGIFIGHSMGLAFFSKMEDAGQTSVVVWDSAEDAQDYMKTWGTHIDHNKFRIEPVEVASPDYATIPELVKAGLGDHLGLLMVNIKPEGQA